VVDTFPFEVSETGWGEFEILIKIFFQDPSEKHVSFFHQLQLYPKDDTSLQGKKPVLSDHYDELVSFINIGIILNIQLSINKKMDILTGIK